jgi:CheY-like chemotaxis protein
MDDPGVRLHVAGDVASGISLLKARYERRNGHSRWLVLLDLNLPGASGLEFLERLRATPGLSTIPVVVVTTSADQRDLREAFSRFVSGYFLKPIDPAEFRRTLRAITAYWSACEMPT